MPHWAPTTQIIRAVVRTLRSDSDLTEWLGGVEPRGRIFRSPIAIPREGGPVRHIVVGPGPENLIHSTGRLQLEATIRMALCFEEPASYPSDSQALTYIDAQWFMKRVLFGDFDLKKGSDSGFALVRRLENFEITSLEPTDLTEQKIEGYVTPEVTYHAEIDPNTFDIIPLGN